MSVCLYCVWRQLWVTASTCRNSWKSLPPLFSPRNLFSCSTLLPKLVPEIYSASRLVQETCTCVLCWSILYKFFMNYKFHAHNWAQLCSRTETVRHMTWTVQHDWPESFFGARYCDELASNFSCKFLEQVSCTSFLSVYCWHKTSRDSAVGTWL